MKHLPTIMSSALSDAEKSFLPKAKAQADLFGCPSKFLYFAEDDYTEPGSYKIHPFRDVQIKHLNDTVETISATKQYNGCVALVNSFFAERGKLIVINAYPDIQEGYLFLWHLVAQACSLRIRDLDKKTFAFNYVGYLQLESDCYAIKPHHVMACGPCVDEMNWEKVTGTVDFITRFSDFTRILMCSTAGVVDLLEKLKLAPSSVDTFIYLSQKKTDLPKKRAAKKQNISI